MADTGATWYNGISQLFTQIDIEHMLKQSGGSLNLGNYNSVVGNANAILSKVASHDMPPPPEQPWADDMVNTLKTWISSGFPEGTPPAGGRS